MLPHEAAQSVAWFAFAVVIGIGVILWYEIRKDKRDAQKQVAKGP